MPVSSVNWRRDVNDAVNQLLSILNREGNVSRSKLVNDIVAADPRIKDILKQPKKLF